MLFTLRYWLIIDGSIFKSVFVLPLKGQFTLTYGILLPYQSVISMKLLCDFIEITLRHGCSPVDLLHVFRAPFHKNTYGEMLLKNIVQHSIGTLNFLKVSDCNLQNQSRDYSCCEKQIIGYLITGIVLNLKAWLICCTNFCQK